MYRNVLVGVDQREGSHDAAVLARALGHHCERMSLVNVRQQSYPGMRGLAPGDDGADRERSQELLRAVRGEFAPDAELLSVAATSPSLGIKDTAKKIEADLIVVGSCHRSAIGRVVSGNDASQTLHHAPCAVAVAPRGYAASGAGISTVGVAYDGSPQSIEALAVGRRLAEQTRARLKAMDVEQIKIYGYGWAAPYIENQDILIANARERLGDLDLDLEVVVGEPADELVRYSQEVDLLVCGSRDRGPVKRVMLGSTSGYLVRHARSALLIVPAAAGPAQKRARERHSSTSA